MVKELLVSKLVNKNIMLFVQSKNLPLLVSYHCILYEVEHVSSL